MAANGGLDVLLNQISYTNRKRVRDDINQLAQSIKTLVPKTGTLSK